MIASLLEKGVIALKVLGSKGQAELFLSLFQSGGAKRDTGHLVISPVGLCETQPSVCVQYLMNPSVLDLGDRKALQTLAVNKFLCSKHQTFGKCQGEG